MSTELLNAIGKYGFATVAALALGVYYRVDVVVPTREQNKQLIQINQLQADTQAQQTVILKQMNDGIEQIKVDQKKFPAVSGNP